MIKNGAIILYFRKKFLSSPWNFVFKRRLQMADFRTLTTELKQLIGQLKRRCTSAEARVTDLQRQIDEQEQTIDRLEAEKAELETKYRNLQTGLAATGRDPQQVAKLREQYLAMVSEIDACIAKLQK